MARSDVNIKASRLNRLVVMVDCACYGQYAVHCNDCDDRDLEEWQAQDILDKYN